MVEAGAPAEELVAAFSRLRGHWKGIFESLPESESKRESVAREVDKDLSAVTTSARVSDEAAAFVETAFRVRLGELGVDPSGLSEEASEVARSLRSTFENLVRSLQQMESGDDILPETGREMRRSAARAVAFFHELRTLDGEKRHAAAPCRQRHSIDPAGPPGRDRDSDRGGEEAGGDVDEAPGGGAGPSTDGDAVLRRLVQSYDGRRKMIRDDTEIQPPAVEAVEFLLRLGAG